MSAFSSVPGSGEILATPPRVPGGPLPVRRRRTAGVLIGLGGLPLGCSVVAVGHGMVTIAPGQVLAILAHQLHPELPWTFTLGADLVARTLVAPAALPLGIVTAMLGASFFLYLLLRHRGQWGL